MIFLENKYHIKHIYVYIIYVCVFYILYKISESVYMRCERYLYEVRIKSCNQHCFKELLLLTVLVQMRGGTHTFSRTIHQSCISQIFTELLHQACLWNKVFKNDWNCIKLNEHFTLNLHKCNVNAFSIWTLKTCLKVFTHPGHVRQNLSESKTD